MISEFLVLQSNITSEIVSNLPPDKNGVNLRSRKRERTSFVSGGGNMLFYRNEVKAHSISPVILNMEFEILMDIIRCLASVVIEAITITSLDAVGFKE